jgi:hypothetical protein
VDLIVALNRFIFNRLLIYSLPPHMFNFYGKYKRLKAVSLSCPVEKDAKWYDNVAIIR